MKTKQAIIGTALLTVLTLRLGSASADWEQVAPFVASDVAAGGQQVYFIGDYVNSDVGGPIYRLQNGRISYLGLFGKAITACSDGMPWVAAGNGDIYKGHSINGDWEHITGIKANDIGCGDPGMVVIIQKFQEWEGNGRIYRWKGEQGVWHEIGGGAIRVDVDKLNRPWVVNSFGDYFRGDGGFGYWKHLNKYWDDDGNLHHDFLGLEIGVDNARMGGPLGVALDFTVAPYFLSEGYAWSRLTYGQNDYFLRMDVDNSVVYAIHFDGRIYKTTI